MSLSDDAWKAAVKPAAVLARVEARLVAAGAITELRQLHGMSAREQDVLVWLELHEPLLTPENVHKKSSPLGQPTSYPEATIEGVVPSCPQTPSTVIAA